MSMDLPDSRHAIARLEAVLNSPAMPAREVENCTLLLDRLTRPVRVGVFGLSGGGDDWLLGQLLGPGILPQATDWPTLEIVLGPQVKTHATFEDGSTVAQDGPASAGLLAEAPVFLRIEAPNDLLSMMRFLYLACDDSAEEVLGALDWAEPRTDLVLWATRDFPGDEARIWAMAPDKLKNHAHLVATRAGLDLADLQARSGYDFDGVFAVPRGGDSAVQLRHLLNRLEEDISDARAADLDAAQLFLHRLGHLVPATTPRVPTRNIVPSRNILAVDDEPAPARAETKADETPGGALNPAPELQDVLSEPLLYLKRRARALLELIEWRSAEVDDPEQDEDWAEEVLTHCCETTEALQGRAMDWPDEPAGVTTLRRSLDEACDVAILLQVEGGKDQAADAAMMLLQLRGDFERELAA